MSRINSNVPSLIAQRHLSVSQGDLSTSLQRLSSGLKINRGADNPAGLIVSERLRAEIASVNQAIDNTARAINVIATTEGALNEVAALLIDIQALTIEAANSGAFSDEEIAANQLQIDDAINSITRIANTTTFAGRKLLNGQLDYVLSGIDSTQLDDVKVQAAKFGTQPFVPVEVDVSVSAQQAQLAFTAAYTTGSPTTVSLTGPDGIVSLTFPASATAIEIVAAINQRSDDTGVYAVASGTSGSAGLRILTQDYGSRATVSVQAFNPPPDFIVQDRNGAQVTDTQGRDAEATINGVQTNANGLELAVQTANLSVQTVLDEDFGSGETGLGTSSFAIKGGGALFQLGPRVTPNLQENIGVTNMQANRLGNAIVGYLSELQDGQRFALNTGNFIQAQKVVDEVITQVSVLRGRLGAFERNALQTNVNQLQITSENLTSSQAVIRDTDFAEQTSELTRSQILVQAGNSVLAIANAQSQNVLTLLGG
ncbi:MAG: flagellin N-terminal helical domain-containing protein [Planctomycetota bacterium]|jgi:flagellin